MARIAKPRIVILGGGFAGAYCARAMEKELRGVDAEIVLIDRRNFFIFYPLLVEAGTGSVQPRHAVVPMRKFLKRTGFVMADLAKVDLSAQSVRYRLGNGEEREMRYDHLVLALGSVTNLPQVPGLREYAYEMKSLADAISLRDRAIQQLELANALGGGERVRGMLRMIVVGANYTGVEVAGELDEYMKKIARRYPNLREEDVQIVMVERANRILLTVDEESAKWAEEHLRRRGLDVRTNESAAAIYPDHVDLKSGGRIDAQTVIWCAGIAPPPILKEMGVPTDEKGWMLCEPDFRVKGFGNVWGIGDCAVNPSPDGKSFPPTAQFAVQEGKFCAKNIAKVLRGEKAEAPDFKSKGMLAAFGRFDAVANVFGVRLTGFPAWFLWRTVYLFKMPGIGRKVRVAIDWTLDLLFGRDYVELGLHRVMRSAPPKTPERKDAVEGTDRQKETQKQNPDRDGHDAGEVATPGHTVRE